MPFSLLVIDLPKVEAITDYAENINIWMCGSPYNLYGIWYKSDTTFRCDYPIPWGIIYFTFYTSNGTDTFTGSKIADFDELYRKGTNFTFADTSVNLTTWIYPAGNFSFVFDVNVTHYGGSPAYLMGGLTWYVSPGYLNENDTAYNRGRIEAYHSTKQIMSFSLTEINHTYLEFPILEAIGYGAQNFDTWEIPYNLTSFEDGVLDNSMTVPYTYPSGMFAKNVTGLTDYKMNFTFSMAQGWEDSDLDKYTLRELVESRVYQYRTVTTSQLITDLKDLWNPMLDLVPEPPYYRDSKEEEYWFNLWCHVLVNLVSPTPATNNELGFYVNKERYPLWFADNLVTIPFLGYYDFDIAISVVRGMLYWFERHGAFRKSWQGGYPCRDNSAYESTANIIQLQTYNYHMPIWNIYRTTGDRSYLSYCYTQLDSIYRKRFTQLAYNGLLPLTDWERLAGWGWVTGGSAGAIESWDNGERASNLFTTWDYRFLEVCARILDNTDGYNYWRNFTDSYREREIANTWNGTHFVPKWMHNNTWMNELRLDETDPTEYIAPIFDLFHYVFLADEDTTKEGYIMDSYMVAKDNNLTQIVSLACMPILELIPELVYINRTLSYNDEWIFHPETPYDRLGYYFNQYRYVPGAQMAGNNILYQYVTGIWAEPWYYWYKRFEDPVFPVWIRNDVNGVTKHNCPLGRGGWQYIQGRNLSASFPGGSPQALWGSTTLTDKTVYLDVFDYNIMILVGNITVTNQEFDSGKGTLTVTSSLPNGTDSILQVFCGLRGQPAVTGTDNWTYSPTTQIATLYLTHTDTEVTVVLHWAYIPWELSYFFIGLMGIFLMNFSLLYGAYKVKKGDIPEGIGWGLVLFVIAIGLVIVWLWR